MICATKCHFFPCFKDLVNKTKQKRSKEWKKARTWVFYSENGRLQLLPHLNQGPLLVKLSKSRSCVPLLGSWNGLDVSRAVLFLEHRSWMRSHADAIPPPQHNIRVHTSASETCAWHVGWLQHTHAGGEKWRSKVQGWKGEKIHRVVEHFNKYVLISQKNWSSVHCQCVAFFKKFF